MMLQFGTKLLEAMLKPLVLVIALGAMGGCTSYHKPVYSGTVGSAVAVDCRNAGIMINYWNELINKDINEAIMVSDYNNSLRHQIVRVRTKCKV